MVVPDAAEGENGLTGEAADALITERLNGLGYDPAYVSQPARALLIASGAGSRRALQRALSATLFLAATEEVPRIGPADVTRATGSWLDPAQNPLPDAPARPPAPLSEAPGGARQGTRRHARPVASVQKSALRGRAIRPVLAGLTLSILFAAASWRLLPGGIAGRQAGSMPAARDIGAIAQTIPARQVPAAATPPRLAQTIAPVTIAPEPAALSAPADGIGPPASLVTLLLPAHAAHSEARHVAAMRTMLHDAGISSIREERGRHIQTCRGICYFYAEDRPLALRMETLLARLRALDQTVPAPRGTGKPLTAMSGAGRSRPNLLPAPNSLRPTLLVQPQAHPALPPGSVALNLP